MIRKGEVDMSRTLNPGILIYSNIQKINANRPKQEKKNDRGLLSPMSRPSMMPKSEDSTKPLISVIETVNLISKRRKEIT